MTSQRILVAGIGNIFQGDDAFGVEVAQRLLRHRMPEGVRVVDYGIRGLDLAYALLDGYDATIMVDATARGGQPGTLYIIEPDLNTPPAPNEMAIEPHGMHPVKVLNLAKSLGATPQHLVIVGCEPETLGPEEGLMGLSDSVQLAVEQAVDLVELLVENLLDERGGVDYTEFMYKGDQRA